MKRTTAILTAALFLFLATAGGALAQSANTQQNTNRTQLQTQEQVNEQNQLRIEEQKKIQAQTQQQESFVQELDEVLNPDAE